MYFIYTAPYLLKRRESNTNLILNGFKESPVCALKMVELSRTIYTKDLYLWKVLSSIFKRLNIIVNDLIEELIVFLPAPIIKRQSLLL